MTFKVILEGKKKSHFFSGCTVQKMAFGKYINHTRFYRITVVGFVLLWVFIFAALCCLLTLFSIFIFFPKF